MNLHNHLKLEVYQRSLRLASNVIKLSTSINSYRLCEQLISAAISIPSNIAEGSKRTGKNEFKRFLEYSSGSADELETILNILCESDLKLTSSNLEDLLKEINIISRMLTNLKKRM